MIFHQSTVDDIHLWLAARQVEAVHLDNRLAYETLAVLRNDLNRYAKEEKYPWDIITQAFKDKAAEQET